MNILELYSGIGGMHLALQASQVPGEIIASIDINTVANKVYGHNFPKTNLLNRNIQKMTPESINKLGVNTILMSPPCQPFTRNGLKNDAADARSCSLIHIIEILPQINVDKLLLENVKGFETSEMRQRLVNGLEKAGFGYREFILSPTQVGVPNTRHRYYCLAKKGWNTVTLETKFPTVTYSEPFEIETILEKNINLQEYSIPNKVLQNRAKVLDICYKNSKRSCCFTKAYGRYMEGTGSVFTEKTEDDVKEVFKNLENYSKESDDYMICISKLNLRFFSPREVCRLMSFPETFSFPDDISNKQRYMLLGNSINVKVVAELIKILTC